MKRASMVLALLVALVAMPASADEGQVSRSALNAVGLRGMQVQTDAEGMAVRGRATFSGTVQGSGLLFAQLMTPDNFNFSVGSGANSYFVNGTSVTPGTSTVSGSHAGSLNVVLNVLIPSPFVGVATGSFSGSGSVTATLP